MKPQRTRRNEVIVPGGGGPSQGNKGRHYRQDCEKRHNKNKESRSSKAGCLGKYIGGMYYGRKKQEVEEGLMESTSILVCA